MPRKATTDGSSAEPSAMLRAQHAEATRRAVLSAARPLFGRKGYAGTSIDEIAAAARVTKGAVYHHFAGKQALFRAVYAAAWDHVQTRVAEAENSEAAPVDQIVAWVNAYLDAALDQETRRITLIDGPAVLGPQPEDAEEPQAGFVNLRSFIAGAIARGRIVDLDPDALAHLLAGMAFQGGLMIARADDPERTRAALGPALDVMLHGLAPRQKR